VSPAVFIALTKRGSQAGFSPKYGRFQGWWRIPKEEVGLGRSPSAVQNNQSEVTQRRVRCASWAIN
jgi:hypothetical protein